MISTYAKIDKKINDIILANYAWNFLDIRSYLVDLKGIISVYYDKNNIDKNPIFKLINDIDRDCWHHFNENFRQNAIDKRIPKLRVQLKKDLLGQNIITSIKNLNKELYEVYSTLRVSHNIDDLKIINNIFSYLEGLAPRIKKNRPDLFELYKNIMNLTGPCKTVLPKLVQNDKTAGHRIFRKEEEQKIDDSFSNLFSNISNFITEIEKPKIDILEKIEYELLSTPIINQETQTWIENHKNSLKNIKQTEDFSTVYNTNPQMKKQVDELYDMVKTLKNKNTKICEDMLKSYENSKEK